MLEIALANDARSFIVYEGLGRTRARTVYALHKVGDGWVRVYSEGQVVLTIEGAEDIRTCATRTIKAIACGRSYDIRTLTWQDFRS